jgi:putative salt-induced outer membrane protein
VNYPKGLSLVAGALVAAMSLPVAQAAEDVAVGFNGLVGFGYRETRGNTETRATTGNSTLEYVTDGPWRYDANLLFAYREESEITTEERYEVRGTANYFWTPDDYMFGRIDWRKDNFGGVREEWVPGLGYGRVLLSSERHNLRGEISGGYRVADLSDGTREEGAAITGGLRYRWQISPSAEFLQNALVQWSDDNTYFESETGLRTAIVGNLSARFTYIVRHNTDVPAGRANTDFSTQLGLEYRF